jgi:hypothetical protein
LCTQVLETDVVSALKARVHEREGVPPAQQRLLFAGRELEDGDTLASREVGPGSSVQLLLRVCGGAPKKKKKATHLSIRALRTYLY